MSKKIYYVAHPVTGDHIGNCVKVEAWLKWLTAIDPTRIYIAPWVAEVRAHADDVCTPEFYDRVLSDDEEIVQRLDGIVLTGIGSGPYSRPNGLMKSTGMTREVAAAALVGRDIFDLRHFETAAEADAFYKRWWAYASGAAFMNARKVNSVDNK